MTRIYTVTLRAPNGSVLWTGTVAARYTMEAMDKARLTYLASIGVTGEAALANERRAAP